MGGQRKKKSHRPRAARRALLTVAKNNQLSRIDGMEDAANFLSDPASAHILQTLKSLEDDVIQQSQDHTVCLTNKRGLVDPNELLKYPDSPTATLTLAAFHNYLFGWNIIHNYNKSTVDSDDDCNTLQGGLQSYALGFLQAQHLYKQVPIIHSDFPEILDGYVKRRRNDSLAEFLKVLFLHHMNMKKTSLDKSDFERSKDKIRALEMFAHKLKPLRTNHTENTILSMLYFLLGSNYRVTHQDIRTIDAFEHCYQLDNDDIDALYALAFNYLDDHPSKSLDMLEKYLQLAPSCHEKFPEAHYLIGMYHVLNGQNLRQAKYFYDLGQRAEDLRLPFNPPTRFPRKRELEMFLELDRQKSVKKLATVESIS